jgi:release factor glutamine methyltransferase
MGIKKLYWEFFLQLQKIYGKDEAAVITNWVFEKIAAVKKSDILIKPLETLPEHTVALLQNGLQQLLQHKPVQYVLGEAWFYKLKMRVNEHVLIPRPETEELVNLIIKYANKCQQNKSLSIIDIGTGSGCIAIALKKYLPNATVTAIDISGGALSIAKENAAKNNATINFVQMDFLESANWAMLPPFDIIVSNPPYIPWQEKETLAKNVTHFEPATALFVPDHAPLLFYKKIATFGKIEGNKNAKIFVETHEDYASNTAAHFAIYYSYVECIKDIFGKDRMVIASDAH